MWTKNILHKFDGYVIYLVVGKSREILNTESDVSSLSLSLMLPELQRKRLNTKAKSIFVSLMSEGSSRTTGPNVESVSRRGRSIGTEAHCDLEHAATAVLPRKYGVLGVKGATCEMWPPVEHSSKTEGGSVTADCCSQYPTLSMPVCCW